MFTIQQSVTIARPAHEVFAVLASPESIPRWRPDVLQVKTDGPLQLGSEFHETINFGGRKTQTFRVDVFEFNEKLEVAAIAGLGIRPTQRYTLSSSNGYATVAIRVTLRTQGVFRLLEPLLPKMIAGKWRDYAQRLRELLESQPLESSRELRGVPVG